MRAGARSVVFRPAFFNSVFSDQFGAIRKLGYPRMLVLATAFRTLHFWEGIHGIWEESLAPAHYAFIRRWGPLAGAYHAHFQLFCPRFQCPGLRPGGLPHVA